MVTILINGIAARSGGGRSILVNFLKMLYVSQRTERYVVVIPADADFSCYSKENVLIIPAKNSFFSMAAFYLSDLRKIIRKFNVSLIFNLADLIIPVSVKQVYLFDWPYAIYPESIVWKRMSMKEKLFRKFKLLLFKRYAHLPSMFIAQTTVAKERLNLNYNIKKIEVVPNAVSIDNLNGGCYRDFKLPQDRIKLLYLTKYYPHKNIEVFIALGKIIQSKNLPFIIVTTLDGTGEKNSQKILDALKAENLDSIVVNMGTVDMDNVPSLYQQTDALLMPSLLESFSGTYVEAMYHGKPIFTSNYDFAKVVCGDVAFYFDPMEPENIIESIISAYNNPELMSSKIAEGKERLKGFLNWQQVSDRYLQILEQSIKQ